MSGSTAPAATSGVSTTPTSFGGAVKTAALPNRIAKPPGDPRDEGLVGVKGAVGLYIFKDIRPLLGPVIDVDGGPVILRAGVANDVDRERDDIVRGRDVVLNAGDAVLMLSGLSGAVMVTGCCPSSSVHWR